jgi:hypothetical protein
MKILFILTALLAFGQNSYGAETACKEAVALKGAQAAQEIYGGDTTDTECLADYNTIASIATDQYSVSVHCGDFADKVFDVTVQKNGSQCRGTFANEESTGL